MSSADRPGAVFHVVDASGRTVLSGQVGASTGSWSDAYPSVRTIDFSALRRAGTFTITVGGPVAATSPPFRIGSGSTVYSTAIANARRFYEVQRDGADYVPSALRTAPGHLNDEHAMTYLTPKVDGDGIFEGDLTPLGKRIDASGGWWDAGDYLKFLHATSYTETILAAGVRDFPGRMGAGAGAGNLTGEVRFGAEWLLRMWDDRTRTLYYQVGIGSGNDDTIGDHDIWRLPQDDDTYGGTDPLYRYIRNRPVFRAGPAGSPISPNLAGRDSAALALCYQVFHRTHPVFAGRCLRAARHIFALADTQPTGRLLTAIPYDYYPETEWRDDLELGATELARAEMAAGRDPHRLPGRRDALGARLCRWPGRCRRHAQPVRHQRARALRAVPRDRARARPRRLRDHPAGAAGRHAQGARPGGRPEHDRPVPVRVRLGAVGHHDARRRALGDGQRVRPADRHPPLRGDRHRLARRHPRGERLGLVADHRRRHRVPALPAAPGGEHRRLA